MITKKWLIGITLIVISTGMVFANGSVDDDDYGYRGRHHGPGEWNGDNYGPSHMDDLEAETFEGRFTIEDERYPAIVTDEGDTYYLMIHDFPGEEGIPEEGSDLKIEAFRSPMSPVSLMVLSAEVNGVELDMDWDRRGTYGRQGMHGRGGMGGGRGGYGGSGAKPGWGYSESEPESDTDS